MKNKALFLGVVFGVQFACLESPLIQHVDADEVVQQSESQSTAQNEVGQNSQGTASRENAENTLPESSQPTELNCQFIFNKANICGQFVWISQQTDEELGVFELSFIDQLTGGLVGLPYPLSVRLWMPSMGHGSSPVRVENIGLGRFRVSRVYFSMPGDWEIQFYLKNGSQIFDSSKLSFDI